MHQRGFTLVEILVVVVIIGIMLTVVTLSAGLAHGDRELETERDRLIALMDHLRDQAALQNREYGLRCVTGGYQFLAYDARERLWTQGDDDLLRPRELPDGIEIKLWIEGQRVALPDADAVLEPEDLSPQVLLYSSGDLNLFEIELRRKDGGAGVRFTPALVASDRVEVTGLEPERR